MKRVALLAVLTLAGVLPCCSWANREGPVVTCAQLGGGTSNACSEGIIAACLNGGVRYHVCTDSNETTAKTTCEQPWQSPGQYRCKQTDPGCLGCTGAGGSGGAGTGGSGGGSGGSAGTTADPTGCVKACSYDKGECIHCCRQVASSGSTDSGMTSCVCQASVCASQCANTSCKKPHAASTLPGDPCEACWLAALSGACSSTWQQQCATSSASRCTDVPTCFAVCSAL